jgi:hypothetical protein
MKSRLIKAIFQSNRREKGAALIMAMVFLVFVTLTVVPMLSFSAAGIKAGKKFNDKAETLYTADAGIEDAKWQIKFDHLAGKFASYDPHDFASTWAYDLPLSGGQPQINKRNVNISLKNVWVPKDITAPNTTTANSIINNTKLMVMGGAYGNANYNITITYYPEATDILKINTIGIWLPPGFSYKAGSSNLGFEPSTSNYQGGQAVVWNFSAALFTSMPNVNTTDVPMTAKINFRYDPSTTIATSSASPGNTTLHVANTAGFKPTGTLLIPGEPALVAYSGITANTFTGIPSTGTGRITVSHAIGQAVAGPRLPDAISWVNTSNVSGLTYTWDDTVRLFHITSIGDAIGTSLSNPAASGSTMLSVTSTTGFPDTGNLTLPFEQGSVSYSGKTSTSFTGIPPSGIGSIKLAHASGEKVACDATSIDTYVAKSELRKLGGALNGDYFATGNSLMKDSDSNGTRETRVNSSAVVGAPNPAGADNGIPADANIAASYLYWGTWYQNTTGKCTTIFTDDGSKFFSGGGYFDNGSAWNLYPWATNFRAHYSGGAESTRQLVEHNSLDLHSYNAAPYITTISWEQWVSSTNPLMPPNADACSNFNNWNKPSNSSWSTSSNTFRGHYSASSAYNRDLPLLYGINLNSYLPNTVTITWDQWESNIAAGDGLNFELSADGGATWSSPIKAFDYSDLAAGHIGTTAKPFTYTFSTSDYLTSNFKIQFSLVGFSSTSHYCYIDNISLNVPTPTYTSADKLQLSISNDNGTTWSSYITAFSGDKIGTSGYLSTATYQYTIPVTYLTSTFKVKLNIEGFNSPGQYCNIDNIRVNVLNPDTGITFKIDNGSGAKIVYFDSSGNPASSTNPADQVISTRTQALLTYSYSSSAAPTFNGFAYSCFRDVTALTVKYAHQPVSPATNFNGHATYSAIGDLGDTGQQLSHAGWSLVNIFTGPETLGHQLYLFDNYFGSRQDSSGVHVDWDDDGTAGGSITGFVVPQQVQGEVNSAKLTCFVTEGDDQLTGDSLSINGTKLWDGINSTSNSSGSPNNIWNGKSMVLGSNDGVDIDTPGINPTANPPQYITWNSNILAPGDTSASIDLYTEQDYWFMVYMIISFRSDTTNGGSLNYLIHN